MVTFEALNRLESQTLQRGISRAFGLGTLTQKPLIARPRPSSFALDGDAIESEFLLHLEPDGQKLLYDLHVCFCVGVQAGCCE